MISNPYRDPFPRGRILMMEKTRPRRPLASGVALPAVSALHASLKKRSIAVSAIPRQGLQGQPPVLQKRHEVYEAAKASHPERWNGRSTRNWDNITEVFLNALKRRIHPAVKIQISTVDIPSLGRERCTFIMRQAARISVFCPGKCTIKVHSAASFVAH